MAKNENTLRDLSFKELYITEQISKLTLQICKAAGINFLSEIIAYYNEHGHFDNIKNCGPIASAELKAICKYYKHYPFTRIPEKLKSDFNIKLIDLTADQMSKLQEYAESLVPGLGARARNALKNSVGRYNGHGDLLSTILDKQIDFISLGNVGHKTVAEIAALREKCIGFINEMKKAEDKILLSLLYN